jgi:hypothetical protein
MKHTLLSLLVLRFANSSSRSLVLHRNGALVPADTAEVAAARDLHLQALAAASAPEPEEGEGEWASEDGGRRRPLKKKNSSCVMTDSAASDSSSLARGGLSAAGA